MERILRVFLLIAFQFSQYGVKLYNGKGSVMLIAICDDSRIDAMLSKTLIIEYFKKRKLSCTVRLYESGPELLEDAGSSKSFDIIFMDIYVGQELGIDIARRLRNDGYENLLIFSTITDEYAIESYSVSANGYILKPYNMSRLEAVLDRVLEKYDADYMRVKVRNTYVNIPYSNIVYIESRNNRCILHTEEEEYSLYMRLDEIEDSISDEESRFLRCHRSYIVNMDHIIAVDEQFRLDNGDSALIRSKSRAQIKKYYIDYEEGRTLNKV